MILQHTREQLELTVTSFEKLKHVSQIKEFITQYHSIIHDLDRIYNMLKAELRDASHLLSDINKDRKENVVLSYLTQSRNAKEHTIRPVTNVKPEAWTLSVNGPFAYIDHLEVRNGKIIKYKGSPADITITGPEIELIPVSCRGSTYDVPLRTDATGLKMKPLELIDYGIFYYNDKILAIENKPSA